MKKEIIKLCLLFVAIFLLNNCNDDFLERYPLDEISEQTFFRTEEDLKNYSNSIYEMSFTNDAVNKGFYNKGVESLPYLDFYSDNCVGLWTNECNDVKSGHLFQIIETPRIHGYHGWNFLREVNYGLQNYHKADIDNKTINIYVAEAKLFRAWFYYNKVCFFGDVQWINKPLNTSDIDILYGTRNPREEVMDSVLADINFAVEYLPVSRSENITPSTAGKFTKWHALFLKSRICLFEGTWRKYHNKFSNPNMWINEAATSAKQIIDNGPYTIYNTGNPEEDYNYIYRLAYDLHDNPEVLYWWKFKENVGFWAYPRANYATIVDSGGSKDLVDDYLCTNGEPIVTKEGINPFYAGDEVIENVFKNRDPRLRQSLLDPGDAKKYNFYPEYHSPLLMGMSGLRRTTTGYHIIKMWNRVDAENTNISHRGRTPIIMRYAEVLLNYIEAKAELGDVTQNDLDITINVLRDRVDMPHLKLDNIPDDPRIEYISPLLTEIRRERRVELFLDGRRYKDLLRWKQGKKLEEPTARMGIQWNDQAKERYKGAIIKSAVIKDPVTGEMKEYIDAFKGTRWENPVFDETKHYLWPLPLSAISQNPNLKQNPGWE